MKFNKFVELLNDMSSEYGDYDLCISEYLVMNKEKDLNVIIDNPLVAVSMNDETKEIRLVVNESDINLMQQVEHKMQLLNDS